MSLFAIIGNSSERRPAHSQSQRTEVDILIVRRSLAHPPSCRETDISRTSLSRRPVCA
jgi:hypothetical protein